MTDARIIGLILVILPFAFACEKEKVENPQTNELVPTLQIDVLPVYGTNVLYLDSTYVTPEGYEVQFTDLKFYLEGIKNGTSVLKDAALFDYRERGNLLCQVSGNFESFGNLQGNIGVDSSLNHDDPSAFSNSSWLNIANANDMHWGWNPGYIFIKIQAKVDTIQDANALFDHNVVFHIGLDANLTTFSFTNCQWQNVGTESYNLPLKLDMLQFLTGIGNPIDLKTEYTSHSAAGQEILTSKVALNFNNALSLY